MTALLTTAALLDRGMSARQIRRDVTAHVLVRVHPGFYVPSEQYRRLSPAERRRLKHEAFSRHAAAPPLYCLASAALMLGFDLRRPPEKLHMLALPGAGTRNGHGGVIRHEAELPEEDMVYRDGVLTTTPERTLLDCARLLPFDDAVVLADQAARFHVSEGRLRQRLPELAGRRGVRRAEAVLDTMEVRSESVAETLTRLLILGSHLPRPEVQWVVRGRSRRYRADFAWPDYRVIAEFDGRSKYSDDPVGTAEEILTEHRRETEIQEQGWTVLRLDRDDLEKQPDQVITRLHQALRRNGWR